MENIDKEQLLQWLAKELAPICDAEPDVLAKYVYALLKHEGSAESLRDHCIAELSNILKDHAEQFVDSLLDTIENREMHDEDEDGRHHRNRTYSDDEHNDDRRDDYRGDRDDYGAGRRRYSSSRYESAEKRRRMSETDESRSAPKSYHETARRDTSSRQPRFDQRRAQQQQYMGYMPPYMMQGMSPEMMWGGYPPMMGNNMAMYEPAHAAPPPMPRVQALLGLSGEEVGSAAAAPVAWPSVEETHTLRCTGIPTYIKENELLGHFRSFGRIVKLELRVLGNDSEAESGRKVYNECVVQFVNAADMKKCLSSPIPVLNNRFIKLYVAPVNLVPLSEVPHHEEPREVIRGGRGRGRGRGSMSWVAPPADNEENGTSTAPPPVEDEQVTMEKQRQQSVITKQYEELRQLRQTAEAVWQKKEDLLQGQIDQYRSMMAKLDNKPDTAEKNKMLETIEGKIVALQGELQEVRQQRAASQHPVDHEPRGGYAYSSRGRWNSRGRGRGRGPVHRTLDNRTSAVVIAQPPENLTEDSAKNHFSRYGEVSRVESTSDGLVVEFKSRRDAIAGLKRGSNFEDRILSMNWYEKNLESPRVPE